MHKLINYICDELDDLERKAEKDGKLSMAEVQYMDTLAHAKKNLLKSEEMSDGEYSGANYNMRGSDMDRSYARGRRGNVRRDSMGRYSSRGGYSMGSNDFAMELRDLAEDAPDERTKMKIEKLIKEMDQM